MRLQAIEVQNFQMLGPPVSVQFPKSGLVLISAVNHDQPELGPNACGKSSLVEAISWTLYGRTPRGVRGRSAVTWGQSSGVIYPTVCLQVELHGKSVKVQRNFTPERITFDGVDVDGNAEKWLGLSAAEFDATVSIPQEFKSFVDMTPAQRLKLIGPAFELSIWDDAIRKAGAASKSRRRSTDCSQRAWAFARGRLDSAGEDLESLADVKYNKKVNQARHLVRSLEKQIVNIDTCIEQKEQLVIDLGLEVEEDEKRKQPLWDSLHTLQVEHDKQAWHVKEHDSSVRAQNIQIRKVKKGSGNCSVCRRVWPVRDRKTLIVALRQERDFAKVNMVKAQERVEELAGQIKIVDKRLVVLARRLLGSQDQVKAAFCDNQKLQQRRKLLVSQREEAVGGCQAAKEAKARHTAALARHRQAEREAANLAVVSKWCEADLGSSEDWKQRFSRIKLWLADQRLAELSERATGVLADLGMADHFLTFAAARQGKSGSEIQGLHVQVQKQDLGEVITTPIESWSGGEKQRLRIACSVAVGSYILESRRVEMGFEIYDEPTAHLTVEGVTKLFDFLRRRAQDKLVIVIDHRAPDLVSFDHVYLLNRQGNRVTSITKN